MTTTAAPTTTCSPVRIVPCEEDDYAAELVIRKPNIDLELFRYRPAYRVQYQVRATCNLDNNLFVVQKLANSFSGSPGYEFLSVAMPLDLAHIPIGSFDAEGRMRVSIIDVRFDHYEHADLVTKELKIRIKRLINALKALKHVTSVDSVTARSTDIF